MAGLDPAIQGYFNKSSYCTGWPPRRAGMTEKCQRISPGMTIEGGDFVVYGVRSNSSAARECPGFGSGFVGGALQFGAELIAPFMDRSNDQACRNSKSDKRRFR